MVAMICERLRATGVAVLVSAPEGALSCALNGSDKERPDYPRPEGGGRRETRERRSARISLVLFLRFRVYREISVAQVMQLVLVEVWNDLRPRMNGLSCEAEQRGQLGGAPEIIDCLGLSHGVIVKRDLPASQAFFTSPGRVPVKK